MPQLGNGGMSVILDHTTSADLCQFDGLLQRLRHPNYAGPLALSQVPSYKTFVRTSFENASLIWNPRTWSTTTPIRINKPAPYFTFSENGSRVFCHSLVAKDGPIMCAPNDSYNFKQDVSVKISMRPEVTAFTFSFDGTKIVIGYKDGTASLHTIDPHVTTLALPIRHREEISALAVSRNLSYIASASGMEAFIWDITSEYSTNEPSLIPHRSTVESIVFSPDETLLISSDDNQAYVWEADTCRQKHSFAFRRGGPNSLAFSPDSKTVLAGSMDGSAHSGQNGQRSPGGRFVLSTSANEILCWRLDAVKVIGSPLKGRAPSVATVIAVCFSADESRIVGADEDGMAYYWDSTTLELLSSLPGCVQGASSLSFSLDGDIIVVMLKDNRRVVLKVENDVLSIPGEDEHSYALQKSEATPKSTFFDLDRSPITFDSDLAVHNRRLKGVRWYPSRCDSLILAYVNNYIIRGGKDGTFVIIPVGDISLK
ncbi:hypothetical protein DXG01_002804 [Tephrocybe rancida]|nr:hypothetical protein DXG01_002804 [Tephrocybe rancida]